VPVPAKLNKKVLQGAFVRHFSKLRPWNRGYQGEGFMDKKYGTTTKAA
jgi:hypothetical protein